VAKKHIAIDEDLLLASKKYAEDQLAIMATYGDAPNLSEEQMERLIYDCARYPQELRNMTNKFAARAAKKAAKEKNGTAA
jgi:polyribonucleotide nucleotidyltransferase